MSHKHKWCAKWIHLQCRKWSLCSLPQDGLVLAPGAVVADEALAQTGSVVADTTAGAVAALCVCRWLGGLCVGSENVHELRVCVRALGWVCAQARVCALAERLA